MTQLTPLEAFHAYPFDSDRDFQGGLQSILDSAPPTADRVAIEANAKRFYFSRRTGIPLSASDLSSQPSSPSGDAQPLVDDDTEIHEAAPPSVDGAPYPPTFAQLAELIQMDRMHLIPNNEIVPNTVLEGHASESTLPAPRKPWETTAPAQEPSQSQNVPQ
ncbi:hypothetical protein CALVIDRAFT_568591 [Calocera viscosa TUFC12733]|uniref:Uncharacterized protein n=1 Tax=Calocera viscosa (strain TUFC12733) TaxID=1330018 RepID=A0A167GY50_CALVF|nr:hypothetical protein CALVIDRAFT_568591 [Calocera viscosa TUFC12733]